MTDGRSIIADAKALRGEQLSHVARAMCVKCWTDRDPDRALRDELLSALTVLNGVGIVATFADGTSLRYFAPRASFGHGEGAALAAEVDRRLQDGRDEGLLDSYFVFDIGGAHVVGSRIAEAGDGRWAGHCALIYTDDESSRTHRPNDSFHGHSTVGILFQVLQHRMRLFSPFAPRISERYWADAVDESLSPEVRLLPPWAEPKRSALTATLSIDLRKSTFCMENATDPALFAAWLDDLARILTAVTHLHGGVFDKFTGDGALVHFLDRESAAIFATSAISAAAACAASMHRAMERHIEELRGLLWFNSALVGTAIGIDIGVTHWSIDSRGTPLTVGRGVVNACRLSDGEAGVTRLTNKARQLLLHSDDMSAFRDVPFVGKEHPEPMKIRVWEAAGAAAANTTRTAEVEAIVSRVHAARGGAHPYRTRR